MTTPEAERIARAMDHLREAGVVNVVMAFEIKGAPYIYVHGSQMAARSLADFASEYLGEEYTRAMEKMHDAEEDED